jgi:hypothetical protein
MDLPDGSTEEAAHPVLLSLARVKGALDEADTPKSGRRGSLEPREGPQGGAGPSGPPAPGAWARAAAALDGAWGAFGLDLCALSLLVAALVAANLTSLAFLGLMALASPARRVGRARGCGGSACALACMGSSGHGALRLVRVRAWWACGLRLYAPGA